MMINEATIRGYLEEELGRRDLFLVEVNVRPVNKIVVFLDSIKGVTLEECMAIHRFLESKMDRNVEDYDLEISSPGLDKPLKLPVQFEKNKGRMLEVVKTDGIKVTGKLVGLSDGLIRLEIDVKVKDAKTGKKKTIETIQSLRPEEIKTAKVVISLKK
jgi:ribosome maturation factor RimP